MCAGWEEDWRIEWVNGTKKIIYMVRGRTHDLPKDLGPKLEALKIFQTPKNHPFSSPSPALLP
jgi:hypothetical protein